MQQISSGEAQGILGVSRSYLHQLVTAGRLKVLKLNSKTFLYNRAEILAFKAAKDQKNAPKQS